MIGVFYDVPTDEIGFIQEASDEIIENIPPVEDDVWGTEKNVNTLKFLLSLVFFIIGIYGLLEIVKAIKTLLY